MTEVFISGACEDEVFVDRLAEALAREGHAVRRDLGAVAAVQAVIVVWSENAAASAEARAQAGLAHDAGKLVQISTDERLPPLPFSMLHCVALGDWRGEVDHPGWAKVRERLEALAREWLPGTDSNHRPTG